MCIHLGRGIVSQLSNDAIIDTAAWMSLKGLALNKRIQPVTSPSIKSHLCGILEKTKPWKENTSSLFLNFDFLDSTGGAGER